jgi:hypothetical protein
LAKLLADRYGDNSARGAQLSTIMVTVIDSTAQRVHSVTAGCTKFEFPNHYRAA